MHSPLYYSMAGIRIPKWKRIQTKQLVCLSARRQGSFYCTPVRLQCNCKEGIAYCTFANKLYKKLSKKVSFKVQCLEIDFMRADFGALAPPRSPRGSRAWRHEQRSSCWPPQFPPLCTPSKNVFWMKQSLSVGRKKNQVREILLRIKTSIRKIKLPLNSGNRTHFTKFIRNSHFGV